MRNKVAIRQYLLNEDTFAITLLLIVLDTYGTECTEWTPATIRLELQEDYQVELPSFTLDKIMAAITLLTTDFFYTDVARFIDICNILNGDDFTPGVFNPADALEIMMGVTEAIMIWPPSKQEELDFSPEIREYIRQVLQEEGILKPFDVLELALSDNNAAQVDTDYADDPEMYQAIYETQQSKVSELKLVYKETMESLVQQLESLPLENGNTEELTKRLKTLLQQI
jgi:hypothetical protein